MAADRLEDWAGVLTSPAADTMKCFLKWRAEMPGASSIKEHEVNLIGSVRLVFSPRPGEHGEIAGEFLTRCAAGEYGEERKRVS